ncbi:hypothetical protein IMZ48_03110 [Candidatus Bathyarchaeota archaeon]|nr:hypothetical protein [Candidatus Bathyarchaeota archaeon]
MDRRGSSNGHTNGGNSHTNGHTNGAINGSANGVSHDSAPVPPSYLETLAVRTVYGLVPLKLALDWPVFASYDELSGCAAWMGGRVPTVEEARSIYDYTEHLKQEAAEKTLGKTVPAVNG